MNPAILNYFNNRTTNAATESFNTKINRSEHNTEVRNPPLSSEIDWLIFTPESSGFIIDPERMRKKMKYKKKERTGFEPGVI